MSKYWQDKISLVTGASRGIGARIAVTLANAGVVVIGVSRQPHLVEALNKDVTGEGKILARYCDLLDEQNILDLFKWIKEQFHEIHIFVNNAGIIQAHFLSDSTTAEIKELFDLNVVATSIFLREVLNLMRNKKTSGHIIVLNSILGHRIPEVPMPLFSVYPATKHAITALCQTTRQEIRFHKLNIKLTSINPGMVATDFLKVYSNAVSELPKLGVDDVAQAVMYALETPDHVQVEDITLQAMNRFK